MFWSFLWSRKILPLFNYLTFKLYSTTFLIFIIFYQQREFVVQKETKQKLKPVNQKYDILVLSISIDSVSAKMDQQQNGAQFFKQQIATMTRIESVSKKQAAQIKKDMSNYNSNDRQYLRNREYYAGNFNRQPERRVNNYNNNYQNNQRYYENNHHYQNNQNQYYNFSKGNGRERKYDHQYNNAYQNYNKEYGAYPNTQKIYQKREGIKKIRYKQKIIVNESENKEINIRKIQETETSSSQKEFDTNNEEIDTPDEHKCQKNGVNNTYSQSAIITSPNSLDLSEPEQQCLEMKINLNPTKRLIKPKQQKKFIYQEQLQKCAQFSISKSWQVEYEASITQNMELNLTRQANQFLQSFDNWQKFQDYPLKSVWINFSTNPLINEVKILSLFIVPMKEDLKLQQQSSRFYQLITNKFQFPKKQYRHNEVTSQLCKMRIPSLQNHEINDAILREMVEIKNVRVKCTNCQSKNILQFKESRNSAISCKKCSGRMEISINSLTFYQPK